ncbi:MAG: Gfo/Idh/MocA family oxidoreductase, partial [Candidatus Cryptobacteroides sp.]
MKRTLTVLLLGLVSAFSSYAQEDIVKLGIIGLDTSHSTAFTQLLNTDSEDPYVRRFEVVAAYPYGSRSIESSYKRIPAYIEEVKKYGVQICSSISEMLELVDCVLLETNDGRLHVEQAVEVFKAGKLCYVDKPAGATLGETIALYRLAEE